MLAIGLALIVFIMLISAGLALVRRKWPLPGWLSAALIAVLIAGGAIGTPIGFSVAPKIADRYNATQKTTTIPLEAFSTVEIKGNDDTEVAIENSDAYSLEIRTTVGTDISSLKAVVENGVLKIDTSGVPKTDKCSAFCIHSDSVRLTIRTPKPAKITASGGVEIESDSLELPDFREQIDYTPELPEKQ